MPTTNDQGGHKAAEQHHEANEAGDNRPPEAKAEVKEPDQKAVKHEAGKIIGNG